MIHINYPNGQKPSEDWLNRARVVTDRLEQAPDKPARDKIIDENSQLWGEIKEWLATFSHGKCWFSEALDTFSYLHVEHFRPKKAAKEPDRDGYWWLAFDHLNYRLCGSVGNAKKGSYFPLMPGTEPATCSNDNCDDEARVLIDPVRKSDVDLITFSNGGVAFPAVAAGWDRERAERSIVRYKLNDYAPLRRARENVWNQCQSYSDELEQLIREHRKAGDGGRYSPTRKEQIERIMLSLQTMTKPTAPFSAVARAFLLQQQEDRPWLRNCLA